MALWFVGDADGPFAGFVEAAGYAAPAADGRRYARRVMAGEGDATTASPENGDGVDAFHRLEPDSPSHDAGVVGHPVLGVDPLGASLELLAALAGRHLLASHEDCSWSRLRSGVGARVASSLTGG